jgi:hypothetical protein
LLVTFAAVVLVVAAAGSALGFTDDSSAGGTTFVTAANALKAAGCAAGFGDGSFGYNSNVTRGQDAIFQMACAPGAAYKNVVTSAPTRVPTTTTTPLVLATETITAGINPGGLQVLLVHGHAGLQSEPGSATSFDLGTPTLSVTPPAGGTAASPASIQCSVAEAASTNASIGTDIVPIDCDGGFVVPTGQSLTITYSVNVSVTGPSFAAVYPGSLTAWTTPRGNTVSSTTALS